MQIDMLERFRPIDAVARLTLPTASLWPRSRAATAVLTAAAWLPVLLDGRTAGAPNVDETIGKPWGNHRKPMESCDSNHKRLVIY